MIANDQFLLKSKFMLKSDNYNVSNQNVFSIKKIRRKYNAVLSCQFNISSQKTQSILHFKLYSCDFIFMILV